jgi:hypothetical protein
MHQRRENVFIGIKSHVFRVSFPYESLSLIGSPIQAETLIIRLHLEPMF